MVTKEYKIRELKSGKWVCEIIRTWTIFGYVIYKSVKGFSGLNEYDVGSINYGKFCVVFKYQADAYLEILHDMDGV